MACAKCGKESTESWCKGCRSIYGKEYHELNKERISAYYKEWYKNNKETRRKSREAYEKKNHDRLTVLRIEYAKTWWQKKKEEQLCNQSL